MAKNELLPFADGEDANVLPTSQWEALTDIIENGFQSGIARSEQVNRVLAQGAVASYVLGQLIVDQLSKDATLDKNALYQNLILALQENAKDACLPLSGGNVTGNLTVQSKNIVRSVNGVVADPSGNVALQLGGSLSLVTSGTFPKTDKYTTLTITNFIPNKLALVVVKCSSNTKMRLTPISGTYDAASSGMSDNETSCNMLRVISNDSAALICLPSATSVAFNAYMGAKTNYYVYQ